MYQLVRSPLEEVMQLYLRVLYYSLKNEQFLAKCLSAENAEISDILVYLKENVQSDMEAEHFRRRILDTLRIQIEVRLKAGERKTLLLNLLTRTEAQPEVQTQVS